MAHRGERSQIKPRDRAVFADFGVAAKERKEKREKMIKKLIKKYYET
jgi:hypothetical protein